MGVTLAPSSIPKLRQAIADGEAYRLSRGTDRLPPGPDQGAFWAYITGIGFENPVNQNAGQSNIRQVYSFIRIAPCKDQEADIWLRNIQAYKFVDRLANIHAAIEINARPVPTNEIVKMGFIGFIDEQETVESQPVTVRRPRFAFSYTPTRFERFLPIHDHRDNTQGGFSFATYHPGTSLPQMPWAL